MKLIKINTDHYVIVDGFATDGFFYHKGSIKKYNSGSLPSDCKKITHSTKVAIEDYWNVIELPLSEVKELIGEKSWKGYIGGTEWEVEFVEGKLKIK
jgi:hypothetical protein